MTKNKKKKTNYISLQEASDFCNYSQEYLSLRARQKKLKAVKLGRNWVTKKEWLEEYLHKTDNYISLQEASDLCDYSQEYLSLRARQGKLKSVKLGRNWATKKEWLEMYLQQNGQPAVIYTTTEDKEFVKEEEKGFRFPSFGFRMAVAPILLAVIILTMLGGIFVANNISEIISDRKILIARIPSFVVVQEAIKGTADIFGEYRQWMLDLKGDYFAFVKEKLSGAERTISNLARAPLTREELMEIERRETEKIIETFQQEFQELRKEGVPVREIIREIEVSRITKIEPIREITKEKIITKIDDNALENLQARIAKIKDWEADIEDLRKITKKLQAHPVATPVPTAPIFIGAPGIQVGGHAILASLGVSGMASVSSLGVGGSTTLGSNASDQLNVAATSTFGAPVAIQNTLTLKPPTGFVGKVLDIQVNGVSKFYVDETGSIFTTGEFTFAGPFAVTADSDIPALTVLQTGTGDLVNFSKPGAGSFVIDANGNIVATGTFTLNEPGGQTWEMGVIPGKLTYSDELVIASGGTGNLIFDSASGAIKAAENDVFFTAGGNPIRAAEEQIFRAATPIFRYSMPGQTGSASFIQISRHFASLAAISLPAPMLGTTRVHRLVINYADNIDIAKNSEWRIVSADGLTVYDAFTLPGHGVVSLEIGQPYLTRVVAVPETDWQLEVKIPAVSTGSTIRIFQIFLLTFDEIN